MCGYTSGIEMLVSEYLSDECKYCRMQPVFVVDIAAALISALKDDGTSMGKIYELGGPEVFRVHELVIFVIISLSLINFSLSQKEKRKREKRYLSGEEGRETCRSDVESFCECRQSLCMTQSENGLDMWKFLFQLQRCVHHSLITYYLSVYYWNCICILFCNWIQCLLFIWKSFPPKIHCLSHKIRHDCSREKNFMALNIKL